MKGNNVIFSDRFLSLSPAIGWYAKFQNGNGILYLPVAVWAVNEFDVKGLNDVRAHEIVGMICVEKSVELYHPSAYSQDIGIGGKVCLFIGYVHEKDMKTE